MNKQIAVPAPSWPYWLFPHAHRVPSALRARVCWYPAETATQGRPRRSGRGACWSFVDPSPSWPYESLPTPTGSRRLGGRGSAYPGDDGRPDGLRAELDRSGMDKRIRCPGAELAVLVIPPSPQGPVGLEGEGVLVSGGDGHPGDGRGDRDGACWSFTVPSPSWPYWLSPHAQSVPSAWRARVWYPPGAMTVHRMAMPVAPEPGDRAVSRRRVGRYCSRPMPTACRRPCGRWCGTRRRR